MEKICAIFKYFRGKKTGEAKELKISKSQKQNTKISNTPKNQRNFVHFFALVSKSGSLKK